MPDDIDNTVPFPRFSSLLATLATGEPVKPPPPPPVVAQLVSGLTFEELAALRYKGEDPREFAAVLAPSMGGQIIFQDLVATGPDGKPTGSPQKFVVFQAVVPVPPSLLPADASTMIDPRTQQAMLSERLQKAFVPEAPMLLRFIVRRNALAPAAREGLEQAESGACLPPQQPKPTLVE